MLVFPSIWNNSCGDLLTFSWKERVMLEDEDQVLEELGITRDHVEVDNDFNVGQSVDGDDENSYSTLLGMSRED